MKVLDLSFILIHFHSLELLSPISEQEISESVSENHALLSSNLSGDESRKSRLELEMEQSLYHWMSKSPASTAINSPLKEMIPPSDQTDMLSGIEEKANTSLGMYISFCRYPI